MFISPCKMNIEYKPYISVYWTNHKTTPIQSVAKHSNGVHFKAIVQKNERAMDVTIHHKLLQPLCKSLLQVYRIFGLVASFFLK